MYAFYASFKTLSSPRSLACWERSQGYKCFLSYKESDKTSIKLRFIDHHKLRGEPPPLSIYLSFCLSIYLSIYIYFYFYLYLFFYPSIPVIYLSMHLATISLTHHYLFGYPLTNLNIYLQQTLYLCIYNT